MLFAEDAPIIDPTDMVIPAATAPRSLLASFCVFSSGSETGVIIVNPLASKESVPVPLQTSGVVETCRGLALDAENVYVLFAGTGEHHIAVLSASYLEPRGSWSLAEVADGHSILVRGDFLYVVSTGTDEVVRYRLGQAALSQAEVVWRASATGTDTHHLNSITEWRGNLIVSGFGPKEGDLWSSASNGYIHDITRDARVKDGLYHPHTVIVQADQIYFCESHTKRFCSLESPLFEVNGYARGAAWLSDELVCVASSVGRKPAPDSAMIANPADPGPPAGTCAITVWHTGAKRVVARVDVAAFGPEIYDLMVVPSPYDG